MAHKHSVYDSDNHFSINPITRAIKNESSKVTLIQYDHNSERFTFEIPRMVEEHDMSLCNNVQIHFINIGSSSKDSHSDIHEVSDLQISPDDENVVIFSWLVSSHATQFVGSLNFVIRFECISDDGSIDYVWNTAVHSGVVVSTGIYNSDVIYIENSDILAQWKYEIDQSIAILNSCEETVNEALKKSAEANEKYADCVQATEDANQAAEDATAAAENANNVRAEVEAGGFIESLKELNKSEKFSVWVGTQAEYDALTDRDSNRLYIVTDEKDSIEEIAGILDRLDTAEERLDTVEESSAENKTGIAAIMGTRNSRTFDQLNQIPKGDGNMLSDADMSATDLIANIKTISEKISPQLKSDSCAFVFSCYTSSTKDPNLNASIIKKINDDTAAGIGNLNTNIEIRGTGQTAHGTKNITITVDHGSTATTYEGIFNRAAGGSYELVLVDTTPSRLDTCLKTGIEAKAGNSISDMSELEKYSLIAFRVKIDNASEYGTILAYTQKSRLGIESFYTAGDGVWRVTASYEYSSKKLNINSVSKEGSSKAAYITDIFGIM